MNDDVKHIDTLYMFLVIPEEVLYDSLINNIESELKEYTKGIDDIQKCELTVSNMSDGICNSIFTIDCSGTIMSTVRIYYTISVFLDKYRFVLLNSIPFSQYFSISPSSLLSTKGLTNEDIFKNEGLIDEAIYACDGNGLRRFLYLDRYISMSEHQRLMIECMTLNKKTDSLSHNVHSSGSLESMELLKAMAKQVGFNLPTTNLNKLN